MTRVLIPTLTLDAMMHKKHKRYILQRYEYMHMQALLCIAYSYM